jgi:hypothetical protein
MYEDILVKKGKPRAAKAKSKVKTSEESGRGHPCEKCNAHNWEKSGVERTDRL